MSWIGVDLLKLGVFWRDLSPRGFMCREKMRLWSHHPCGKLCVSVGWVIGSRPSGKSRCGARLDAWRFRALSQVSCSCGSLFGMKVALDPWSWRSYSTPVGGCGTGMGTATPNFVFRECPWCPGKRNPGLVLPPTGFCQTWWRSFEAQIPEIKEDELSRTKSLHPKPRISSSRDRLKVLIHPALL